MADTAASALAAAPASIRAARAAAVAAALPPLLLAAERLAANVPLLGAHGQRRAGMGDAFWQYRPYLQGDPAARIDWRQSGRSDRLFIREREQVTPNTAWLWRDGAARMDWRSSKLLSTKAERADLLLAALAALLLRGGERVGWLMHAAPPVTGRGGLARLLRGAASPPREPAGLRGAIVLAGDFLDDAPALAARRRAFANAKGVVLQVLDPAEVTLPYRGRVRFQGVVDGSAAAPPSALVGRVETARTAYAERLAAQTDAIRTAAGGWPVLRHQTDHAASHALLALHRALA